jgi:hypothetical protein
MRRILLSTVKILVSAALLYFALRKINFYELASRFDIASLGWIGLAIAVTILQIFLGVLAMARDQRGLRRAARNDAGVSLQPDRDLLQSDPAILDRR